MHDRAGERRIGARPQRQMEIRLGGGRRAIGVDHDQLGAPLAARPRDMGHDIDLGRDRIAAPDHDQIGLGQLLRIAAPHPAGAGPPAGIGQGRAKGAVLAGIAERVAQPVDAVALHQPHGAGIVVRPDGLAAMALHRAGEGLGDLVQRLVPAKRLESALAFGAAPAERLAQPVRMVEPLGVAGDLGADHAGRVGIAIGAAHLAEPAIRQAFDLERADARAIMRAHRRLPAGRHVALLAQAPVVPSPS